MFDELRGFKEKHGHTDPKKTEPELGWWTTEMGELYQKNERTIFTDRKIAKLDSLGFKLAEEHTC